MTSSNHHLKCLFQVSIGHFIKSWMHFLHLELDKMLDTLDTRPTRFALFSRSSSLFCRASQRDAAVKIGAAEFLPDEAVDVERCRAWRQVVTGRVQVNKEFRSTCTLKVFVVWTHVFERADISMLSSLLVRLVWDQIMNTIAALSLPSDTVRGFTACSYQTAGEAISPHGSGMAFLASEGFQRSLWTCLQMLLPLECLLSFDGFRILCSQMYFSWLQIQRSFQGAVIAHLSRLSSSRSDSYYKHYI